MGYNFSFPNMHFSFDKKFNQFAFTDFPVSREFNYLKHLRKTYFTFDFVFLLKFSDL